MLVMVCMRDDSQSAVANLLGSTKLQRLTSGFTPWLHTQFYAFVADRHCCCGGDDSQATAAMQLKRHLGWKTGAAAALGAASRLQMRPRPAPASGPPPVAAPGAALASAPAAWRCSARVMAQESAAVAVQGAIGMVVVLLEAEATLTQCTGG